MFDKFPVSVFLATAKAEDCKAFYQSALGLILRDEDDYALVFDLAGAELRVSKVPAFTPQPFTVLDWQVEDLEAAMQQLLENGVVFERFDGMDHDENGVWSTPDGVRIAWFKDPDNNVLSVSKRN